MATAGVFCCRKFYKEVCMSNEDTIHLLKECDAGAKMAVSSIDEVLDKLKSVKLKKLLTESKELHERLGDEIHTLLMRKGGEEKNPSPMAKGMSWLKTNVLMGVKDEDATVADLMTDGCNMGIKSLHKYLNQYPAAERAAVDICERLSSMEEQLCRDLRVYL